MSRICIIGGGNLGSAIAEGLLAAKIARPSEITVTRRNTGSLAHLQKQGVNISSNNPAAVKEAELILLCVKPFQAKEVLKSIARSVNSKQILVSMVSGVSLREIAEAMKHPPALFRAMPNTAVAIAESMTCVSHEAQRSQAVKKVQSLFEKLGRCIFIDEKLMDAATILGACGTAFALRFIRASIQGGIEIGFDSATARLMAAQTVKGAAELLLQHGSHPEEEIDKVTTPKGVTITGLNQMEHHGLSSSVIKGITESFKKMG